MGAVFSDLNKGEGVTSGLRKVDKSEMTHKNPSLRGSAPVPASAEDGSKSGRPSVPKKPVSFQKKPPRCELDGNKWTVENYEGNREIVIADTEISHTINIFSCKNSVIQIKGKVNAISMGEPSTQTRQYSPADGQSSVMQQDVRSARLDSVRSERHFVTFLHRANSGDSPDNLGGLDRLWSNLPIEGEFGCRDHHLQDFGTEHLVTSIWRGRGRVRRAGCSGTDEDDRGEWEAQDGDRRACRVSRSIRWEPTSVPSGK